MNFFLEQQLKKRVGKSAGCAMFAYVAIE